MSRLKTLVRNEAGLPPLAGGRYQVWVGEGVWEDLPDLLGARCSAHRYALLSR
mgnify:CR=1 FL=1